MREALDPWLFVWASYGLGAAAIGLLIVRSWLAMRLAERRRDDVRKKGARGR